MIIIDVGASSGVFSIPWHKKYPTAQIYCFEPNNKNFSLLSKNINALNNIYIFKQAVSSSAGVKDFYEANYTNSSSLLHFNDKGVETWKHPTPTTPKLETISTYDVECVRLDEWMAENGIKGDIDFLKIDTQGHDLEVIKSLGEEIKRVKEITAEVQIVETEVYKNSSKREDLFEYMKQKGFSIWKIQPWSHNQEQNIWFTNNRFKNFLHLT